VTTIVNLVRNGHWSVIGVIAVVTTTFSMGIFGGFFVAYQFFKTGSRLNENQEDENEESSAVAAET
jgi:ABC-type Co2+ transport system permease subunit